MFQTVYQTVSSSVHYTYGKIEISAKIASCSLLSYKIFEAGWSPALNNIVHSQ